MIIEEKDFKLTRSSESNDKFDLELLYTVKPRGGVARDEFKNIGYAMSMDKCIAAIILYRIDKKENTLDLKSFLKAYREECEEIKQLVKLS